MHKFCIHCPLFCFRHELFSEEEFRSLKVCVPPASLLIPLEQRRSQVGFLRALLRPCSRALCKDGAVWPWSLSSSVRADGGNKGFAMQIADLGDYGANCSFSLSAGAAGFMMGASRVVVHSR